MIFKAGAIYMILSMRVLAGAYNKETKKAEIKVDYEEFKKILVVDTKKEVIALTPEIMGIIIENQKYFKKTPRIIKYKTTATNIIVTFDPKFFENKKSK